MVWYVSFCMLAALRGIRNVRPMNIFSSLPGFSLDDVRLADAVHAGDGVETLSFFDSMQKIRLILLCYCTDTAYTGKQQGADNAVNRFIQ